MQIALWIVAHGAVEEECGTIQVGRCNENIRLSMFGLIQNCLGTCQQSKACHRWTWDAHNRCVVVDDVVTWKKRTGHTGTCGFGTKCRCGKRVSGYTYLSGNGNEHSISLQDADSADDCDALCYATHPCATWSWYSGTTRSQCYLFDRENVEYTNSSSSVVSSSKCVPTSALPPTTTSAPLRKNVFAQTVLTLKGALPRHGAVCQNSHPLIQRIKTSLANLTNDTVDIDILVLRVHTRGKIHLCTGSGRFRVRQYLRGAENRILLIEYVLFVSSTAERNLEEIFSGDGADGTHEFADVSDNYTVDSAITTTTDLGDKERYFLDAASVPPEPYEWNAYFIYAIVILVIVIVACGGYICSVKQHTFGLSTGPDANDHKLHDASTQEESRAGCARCFIRRTPSIPVIRETPRRDPEALTENVSDISSYSIVLNSAYEATSDSNSLYPIATHRVPEATSGANSRYPIASHRVPEPVYDGNRRYPIASHRVPEPVSESSAHSSYLADSLSAN